MRPVTEKGVIVAAYKNQRNPRFVVLNRKKNWEGWELPKGHLENDDYRETVRIELGEEAGIDREDIEDVRDLEHEVEWKTEDGDRCYRCFLVKLSDDVYIDTNANPHDEHEKGFFMRESDASSLLTYEDHVEVLEIASKAIDG